MDDDQIIRDPIRIPIGPELDLHTFHPRDIPSVVEEYLHEARAYLDEYLVTKAPRFSSDKSS